jgi:tRNA(Ile2) C34 agmatinyltransferase TiaS
VTDNRTRIAAAQPRALITVDGIVTERTRPDSYTVVVVLTDESGSIDVTISDGSDGSHNASNNLYPGMYAVVTGRIESGELVSAAVTRFATREATRDLLNLTEPAAQRLTAGPRAIGS